MAEVHVAGHSWVELYDQADHMGDLVELALGVVVERAVARLTPVAAVRASVADDLGGITADWEAQVTGTLLPFVAATYESGALEVAYGLAHSLPLPAGQGVPAVSSATAERYLATAKNMMVGLGDDLFRRISAAALEGFQAGESVDEIADRVRAAADLTHARAQAVARTEVMKASNAASLAQAQLVMGPTEQKEWLATEDARTREDHAVADGQRVPVSEPFTVGGWKMQYPGDDSAPADEVVNCRCTLTFVFDDETPPVVTCDCADVTAALGWGPLPPAAHVPLSVTPETCVCPAATPPVPEAVATPALTAQQKQDIYDAFKGQGPISPAYGGAKIYKHLQPLLTAGDLDEFQLLQVIDEVYAKSGGKSSFSEKFEEWVQSAAGKKATGGLAKPATPATVPEHAPQHAATEPAPSPPPTVPTTETTTAKPAPPSADPTAIDHVPHDLVVDLYEKFKQLKPVTPGWGGAAIYKNLQAVKPLLTDPGYAGLNDAQLLKMLDQRFAELGKATAKTYLDETSKYVQTPAGKKLVEQHQAGTATVPPPKPGTPATKPAVPADAPDTGAAGDISGISQTEREIIFSIFKGSGVYLTSPASKIYDALAKLKKMSVGSRYTELQLVRVIDEFGAGKLGVANANLYEKKLVAWLKTPSGAKHVAGGGKTPKTSKTPAAPKTPKTSAATPDTPDQVYSVHPPGAVSTDETESYSTISPTEAQRMQDAQSAWTGTQRAGLRYYTGQHYVGMNNWLRGLSPQSGGTTRAKSAAAQAGMRRSTRPMLLHRGMSARGLGLRDGATIDEIRALIGKTVQDKGFMSTSVGGSAAFSGSILLEIEAPTGTSMAYVADISHFKHEKEMLLAAGTRYVIRSVTERRNHVGYTYTVVRVRVVP